MILLALKLTLVPLLILGITLAGRRWGAGVAGWLSAFPVVSAPILYFIAWEQGTAFTALAAAATLTAILAHLGFGLTYAWAATRTPWPLCLAAGLGGFFAMVALLGRWAPALPLAATTVLAVLIVARRAFPLGVRFPAPPTRAAGGAFDLPWRMAAGAVLVLLVTWFARDLGPRLAGLFAMFPVVGAVLAVFSHRAQGAGFTAVLLAGMVYGYYAFAAFCLTLALTIERFGIDRSFALALLLAVTVQGGLRLVMLRRARAPAPA